MTGRDRHQSEAWVIREHSVWFAAFDLYHVLAVDGHGISVPVIYESRRRGPERTTVVVANETKRGNSPQQTRLVGYLRIIGKPLSALVWGRHELSPRPASPTCGSLLHDRPSSVRTPRRSVGLQPTMTPTHSDQLPLRCPLPADAIRAGVPRGPWGRGRARQPANWSVHSGHAIAPAQDGILRELAGMRQLTGAPIPPPKQTDVSGRQAGK